MIDSRVKSTAREPRAILESDSDAVVPVDVRARHPDAMSVFFAWEKLRLLYNALLGILVVAELAPFGTLLLLPILFELAIVANVCFCVGPVAEGYLSCIGINRTAARWALFVLGTLLSLGLAHAVLTGAVPWMGGPLPIRG